MRLQLTLQHRPKQVLPINYQYLLAAWVYRTLGNANAHYATQLHEQGYDFAGKTYKLFTYSALRPKWFDIDRQAKTFCLTTGPTELTLSFCMDDALQHFVVGLFKDQQFTLESGRHFRAQFEVTGIETLPKPTFTDTMRFRAVTPICLSRNEEGKIHAQYLSPELPEYGELLAQNLMRKYIAANRGTVKLNDLTPTRFRLLNRPKSKLLAIKGVKMRGWLFDFELSAPRELLEVGYFGGFGMGCSALGMGMVRRL
ncbi:MAG: CRISPR-associated endoribonuclease Cas6 [Bacteroidota bacterium]